MKSFNDAALNPSDKKPQAWNPPELDGAAGVSLMDVQKQHALSFFKNDAENSSAVQGKTQKSALHLAGSNQHFAAWQPGNTDLRYAQSGSEWTFIKVIENGAGGLEEESSSRFGSARPGQFLSDHEVRDMLQRARSQAEEIMLAAQAEADDVLLQAQSEIDEQKKAGFEQGRNEARAELDDALKAARAMLGEVEAWKKDLIGHGENILIEMVKDISRKMFGEGLELDKNLLQSNLNRVFESAHGLGNLNIFLNPRDARLLDSSWIDQQVLISGGQVKIIPSGNIARGGCYIKGNMGTVDGRVETQLDAILNTFDVTDTLDE